MKKSAKIKNKEEEYLERIKHITRLARCGYWIWNIGIDYFFVDQSMISLFRWKESDLKSITIDDFSNKKMGRDEADTFKDQLLSYIRRDNSLDGSICFEQNIVLIGDDRRFRLSRVRASLMERDKAGNPKMVLGICEFIAEMNRESMTYG